MLLLKSQVVAFELLLQLETHIISCKPIKPFECRFAQQILTIMANFLRTCESVTCWYITDIA